MDLLPSLKAFCTIAEHGSLTRSSAVMGTAASALSRQIAGLEADIEAKLFHRTGRGVVLTEVGQRLLPRAKAILDECDTVMSGLRGEHNSPIGTVEVGVVPAARPIVATMCAHLQRSYPRIRLRAREAFSGQIEEWVASGKVDVGVFNRYGRSGGPVAEALLLRTPMVIVARRGSALIREAQIPVRALAGVPMAIPIRPNTLVSNLESIALRLRVELQFVFESSSESIIMDTIARADLCAVVPLHLAIRDYGPEHFGWSTISEPHLMQSTWMAQTSARPSTPASRIVAGLIREFAPQLAAGGGKHGKP